MDVYVYVYKYCPFCMQDKVVSNQRVQGVMHIPSYSSRPAILPSLGTTRAVSLTAKLQASATQRQVLGQPRQHEGWFVHLVVKIWQHLLILNILILRHNVN